MLLKVLSACLTPVWLFVAIRFKYRHRQTYRFSQVLGLSRKKASVDIWLHCSSVGEVISAKGMINAWLNLDRKVLVTTYTPTGEKELERLFGDRVQHRFLPIDNPISVWGWLCTLHVKTVVLFEMEFWPNLISQIANRKIPLLVVNARMSQRSFERYYRLKWLVGRMFSALSSVVACTEDDAKRLVDLGCLDVSVSGNVKFDVDVFQAQNFPKFCRSSELVWVAASTHAGEEEMLFDVHQSLLELFPNLLLVIVPRHPERFEQVYCLACTQFARVAKRSVDPSENWSNYEVLIGDSMGELLDYYHYSSVAFIGGSLIPRGGHNPLEAAALNLPVLFGPHVHNFSQIYDELVSCNGATRCLDKDALSSAIASLLESASHRKTMGGAARGYVQQHRGALEQVLRCVDSYCETERNC